MKKIIFLFFILQTGLCNFCMAQSFTIIVKNSSAFVLYLDHTLYHGADAAVPPSIGIGETKTIEFSAGFFEGSEGLLYLYPPGTKTLPFAVIHADNPLVGESTYDFSFTSSPFKLHDEGFDKQPYNNTLTVEITGGSGASIKPIDVPLNSKGIITGTIYWNKKDIAGPNVFPYGKAFTAKIASPTQFIENTNGLTFEKGGIYQGKKGYFVGQKPVGNISYTIQNSSNPDYIEVKYKISGVPTDLPLDFDLRTDYKKATWISGVQKPQPPGDNHSFIVGTFPFTNKFAVTVTDDELQLDGIDFTCEGDWLEIDANGKIVGNSIMVNKIAARKTNPVLPGSGMLIASKTEINSSKRMILNPAIQNNSKNMQIQRVKTINEIKIKQ